LMGCDDVSGFRLADLLFDIQGPVFYIVRCGLSGIM